MYNTLHSNILVIVSLHVEPIPYSGLVVVKRLANLLQALSNQRCLLLSSVFFFATVFRNPVFTSWYGSLSPVFTLYVRVSFTSFGVFFFAGFLVVSKVRLRPEFKEMWALMKGLTESGETLLLGDEISGKLMRGCHLKLTNSLAGRPLKWRSTTFWGKLFIKCLCCCLRVSFFLGVSLFKDWWCAC